MGQFNSAKKLGAAAFILTTISLATVLVTWLVIISSLVGTLGEAAPCDYIYYSTYSGYRK